MNFFVSFKLYYWQKEKISMLVVGLHSKDKKSTKDKVSVQISHRPPLRVYRTGVFNAMFYGYNFITLHITLIRMRIWRNAKSYI